MLPCPAVVLLTGVCASFCLADTTAEKMRIKRERAAQQKAAREAARKAEGYREPAVLDIGSRLELFVDDWLIDTMAGVELQLHRPIPREVAIEFDKAWEGMTAGFVTVFRDGDLYRMYYETAPISTGTQSTKHAAVCYAESRDGISWTKPDLGLVEFEGSTRNNITWDGAGGHCFAPFKDANPDCDPSRRYKALGGARGSLLVVASADGTHWSLIDRNKQPVTDPSPDVFQLHVITKGRFDSLNTARWHPARRCYVAFVRDFGVTARDITTSTSTDFVHWTDPEWLDWGDAPPEHMYTNAIVPYFRAPHICVGFPMRFQEVRTAAGAKKPGISDAVFMSSRDGLRWKRWMEAFIRPGLQKECWYSRCNIPAWGLLATQGTLPGTPDELSLYSTENFFSGGTVCVRRHTLRMDGFVSVNAPYAGGKFATKPLTFEGRRLVINYSTSAVGSIRVEIQGADGAPLEGFTLQQCPEIYGDAIERAVSWEDGENLSALAGKAVRLKFVMRDADLYSLRFQP